MGSVRTSCYNLQAMNGDLRLGAFSKQTSIFGPNLCLHFFIRMWSNRNWSFKGQKQIRSTVLAFFYRKVRYAPSTLFSYTRFFL